MSTSALYVCLSVCNENLPNLDIGEYVGADFRLRKANRFCSRFRLSQSKRRRSASAAIAAAAAAAVAAAASGLSQILSPDGESLNHSKQRLN